MSGENQERREIIPFEQIRKVDTDLAEGEEMVIVEGREGVRFFNDQDEEIYVSEPVAEIRVYGPKSRIVESEIVRQFNPDLGVGEEEVIQEGFSGIEMVDEEGQVIGGFDSTDTIIEYGPIRESIPFQNERISNSSLDEGAEQVLVEGVEGYRLMDEEGNIIEEVDPVTNQVEYGPRRISIDFSEIRKPSADLEEGQVEIYEAGELGLEVEDEEGNRTTLREPKAQKVYYGPKRVALPFETIRQVNWDLEPGQENILEPGKDGLDLVVESGHTAHVLDPVTQVVEYGPKHVPLPFDRVYKVNFDLDEGEENILRPGEEGLRLEDDQGNVREVKEPTLETVEYGPHHVSVNFGTVRIPNPDVEEGEEVVIKEGEFGLDYKDREGNITRITNPIDEEIGYGPKRLPVNFERVRIPNPDLAEGEERVLTEGKMGIDLQDEDGNITVYEEAINEEIEYGPKQIRLAFQTLRRPNIELAEDVEQVVEEGAEGILIQDETGEEEELSAPVDRVIEYGPKRKEVPFETTQKPNVDLEVGDEQVVVEGQVGYDYLDDEGQVFDQTDPVTEVIEYGPERIITPFETKRVPSKILYPGNEEVKVEGVDGIEIKGEDGEFHKVNDPVTEVIEYGQKRRIINYAIKLMPNTDMEPGKEKVITPGRNGYIMIDEDGNKTLGQEPVTQIVQYGPHREMIPYTNKRLVNTDLAFGEERVIAEGMEGYHLLDDNQKIVSTIQPVKGVVEYGPKTRIIPFEDKRELREDLEPGEEIVVSEGIDGIELVDEEGKVVQRFAPVDALTIYNPES